MTNFLRISRKPLQLLLVISFISPATTFATGDKIIANFDANLQSQGVSLAYNQTSMDNLVQVIRSEIDLRRKEKISKKKMQKFSSTLEWIDKQLQRQNSELEVCLLHSALKNILYGIQAEDVVETKDFGDTLKKLARIVIGEITLPFATPEERQIPVSVSFAKNESSGLVNTATGETYLSPESLAGLSIDQIAALDIPASHPMWYQQAALQTIKSKYGSAWKFLEQRIEKEASRALGKEYKLASARKVLLFDEIKSTATSAKVDAKDLFGQGWKVKWSEEIHSEPIANHLAVELGAKFADPVYANAQGKDELILVLQKKQAEPNRQAAITTVEELRKALLASTYEFDVSPYVISSGEITEDNVQNLFSHIELSESAREKLIGRNFVTFKESLVEYQSSPAVLTRIGAIPLSAAHSVQDRVKRGLSLFSYWIQNKDAKDDNSRSVIIGQEYLEFIHDLGASLAGISSSANANQVKDEFLTVMESENQIRLQHRVLYIPKSFKAASMADQLWMAQRIIALKPSEFQSILDSSQWPQFLKDTMASRLISRRNHMAKVYKIGSPIEIFPDRRIVRSLQTPEDRQSVVREFKMSGAFDGREDAAIKHLEQVMKASGVTISDAGQANWIDTLATFKGGIGKVKSCGQSIIISALESSSRPTGLSRRVSRRSDDKPLKECFPGQTEQASSYNQ